MGNEIIGEKTKEKFLGDVTYLKKPNIQEFVKSLFGRTDWENSSHSARYIEMTPLLCTHVPVRQIS